MKLLTTFLTLIFATASASASIDPLDLDVQRDVTSGTIIMRSTIALKQSAAFEITDGFGNLIYADSVAKGEFLNKRFQSVVFSGRDYNILIADKSGKTILPLKMNAKGSIAVTDKAKHLVYPTLNFHSARTMVVACTNKSGQRVDIKIANDKGETVFTDQVSGPEDIQRAYQLDQLQSGAYQLIVSSGDVKNHTTAFALR